MKIEAHVPVGVSGHFRMVARKFEGGRQVYERELASFDNLITDQGLNRMGVSAGFLTNCQVGTGSAPPAFTDTSLQTFLANTSTVQATSIFNQASAPYYSTRRTTYRFAAGVATGNLTEVGIAWSSSPTTLFSRALILDGGGNPTTITILSDEVLDVTYDFRVYPPVADIVGNITISSVNYSYVIRASEVTNPISTFGRGWGNGEGGSVAGLRPPTTGHPTAFNGSLGPVTGAPSGSQASGGTVTNDAYVANSLTSTGTIVSDLNNLNVTGGSFTCYVYNTAWGTFQMSFSPAVPKDATKRLTLAFSHSWSRHP